MTVSAPGGGKLLAYGTGTTVTVAAVTNATIVVTKVLGSVSGAATVTFRRASTATFAFTVQAAAVVDTDFGEDICKGNEGEAISFNVSANNQHLAVFGYIV